MPQKQHCVKIKGASPNQCRVKWDQSMWPMMTEIIQYVEQVDTHYMYVGNSRHYHTRSEQPYEGEGPVLQPFKPGTYQAAVLIRSEMSKCQKPHHTLLHQYSDFKSKGITVDEGDQGKPLLVPTTVVTGSQTHQSHLIHPKHYSHPCQVFLMICQVLVVAPNGYMMQAGALIDLASSMSLITEHLVQWLQLPHQHQSTKVTGIGGTIHNLTSCSAMTFCVTRIIPCQ